MKGGIPTPDWMTVKTELPMDWGRSANARGEGSAESLRKIWWAAELEWRVER